MQFRIELDRAPQRTLRVSLELDVAPGDGDCIELFLPVWTPGSYLVREYARHLGRFAARDAATGELLPWRRTAKNRFCVEVGSTRRLGVDYEVYAHELSVRTAYVTDAFAYWNGACVLLWPVGREASHAEVAVRVPDGQRLVTGLGDAVRCADDARTFRFSCRDIHEAIDTPCLVGDVVDYPFEHRSRRHRVCAVGLEGIAPPASFADDIRRAVDAVSGVFPGELPFREYVFLALFTGAGRGGLEHAASSTLLAPRSTFTPRSAYEDLLSLAAHEYFHVWNVKRMRPAEFWSFDYERENHTELLWVAEGFTAYYDDLALRRAGLTSSRRYLDVLGNHVRSMLAMPGRFAQSLCEASYDAWIRFYRPDENTRNSTQNYYSNGALVAFVLDAEIRRATAGARCLDDALRALWTATWAQGRGYTYEDVLAALETAADRTLGDLLASLVRGPLRLDLTPALELFGLRLEFAPEKPWLGVQFKAGSSDVASVQRESPAWHAGICPGDELIGVGGLRVDGSCFRDVWSNLARVGQPLEVLLSRQGRLVTRHVTPEARLDAEARIVVVDEPTETQLGHREAWLGARDVRDSDRVDGQESACEPSQNGM